MKLYEISAALINAMEAIDPEQSLPPDLEARLDALRCDHATKIEGCCRAIKNFEAEETALKAESDRLRKRAATADAAKDRLKAYVKGNMEALSIDKMEAGLFKVRLQANSTSPLDITVPLDTLPEELLRVTVEPNNEAIRAALAKGQVIEGVQLGRRGRHLRIS